MSDLFLYAVVATILGASLVTGVLLAFSLAVMRALLLLPPEAGMFAMQRINVLIVNPLFLLLFLGTGALALFVAVVAWIGRAEPGAWWLLAGSVAYLLGPLAMTIARNVPLNDRLAGRRPEQAAEEWPRYVGAWLPWNHARSAVGVLSALLLLVGLVSHLSRAT